jgi:type VII secretion integral membrane protein EccD
LACVTATVLTRWAITGHDAHRSGCAGVAAMIALLSLLAASVAYRGYRETSIGLTLGILATGFAGLAGLLAVPGGMGAPNALLAAAAAAASAAAMRAISSHAVAFTTLMALAATGATTSTVAAITAIPLPSIGAAVAALSLALLEASTPVSMMLARLSPSTDPHVLTARAIQAHTWLTALIAAFSASAALGAIGTTVGSFLTGEPRFPGFLFATVTSGVLLLRARTHRDLSRSIPLIVCGIATFSTVLVSAAAAYPDWTAQIAVLSMILGAVALCLGLIGDATAISPIGRRSVELLEYLAFAAVVPLAVWLCGLYGATRSLNLS